MRTRRGACGLSIPSLPTPPRPSGTNIASATCCFPRRGGGSSHCHPSHPCATAAPRPCRPTWRPKLKDFASARSLLGRCANTCRLADSDVMLDAEKLRIRSPPVTVSRASFDDQRTPTKDRTHKLFSPTAWFMISSFHVASQRLMLCRSPRGGRPKKESGRMNSIPVARLRLTFCSVFPVPRSTPTQASETLQPEG